MATDKQGAAISRRELEEKIVARAWKDPEFKRRFLADPKGQFETNLGTRLPQLLKITAHEENENSLHFVIPAKPTGNLGQLSDEDLEKVAGGCDFVTSAVVVTIVATAAGVGSAVGSAALMKDVGGTWKS